MKRVMVAKFLLAIAIAGSVVGCSSKAPLQEDDPGWDCHTMGNHICGPNWKG